jgi:hypothetical protein
MSPEFDPGAVFDEIWEAQEPRGTLRSAREDAIRRSFLKSLMLAWHRRQGEPATEEGYRVFVEGVLAHSREVAARGESTFGEHLAEYMEGNPQVARELMQMMMRHDPSYTN